MQQLRGMRPFISFAALALVIAAPMGRARAQGSWPPPAATTHSRTVVSYEISAALVTRRAPADWIDAVPEPLLARLEADEHFAGMDLGSSAGNGILIRFDFDDMQSYKEWNDQWEVQQMLAEVGEVIGYGYSRSAVSMRRVPVDARATPTAPRRAPASPPVMPAPAPKATVKAAKSA
jgi:hypothetical protein